MLINTGLCSCDLPCLYTTVQCMWPNDEQKYKWTKKKLYSLKRAYNTDLIVLGKCVSAVLVIV